MEIRKVQVTGGSSYVISLPKDWIRSFNIKKNDPLGIIVQSDGTLVITPNLEEQTASKRVKEFVVGDTDDPDSLFRFLVGSYISGYDTIRLRSKNRIPTQIRSAVRRFTDSAIGVEIVEETMGEMIIKDIINPKEMPPVNSIRRMYVMVTGMHRDAVLSLRNKDLNLAQSVISKDSEVDRLHWLVARQQNMISRDLSLAHRMKINIKEAENYSLISRIMERIGDHAVRIARNSMEIIDEDVDDEVLEGILRSSEISMNILTRSTNAIFSKDIEEANASIKILSDLLSYCENISSSVLKYRGKLAISLGYIIESIRRTGEYAMDLAENVINYLV